MAGSTSKGERRRHPSAGNLSRTPTLVEPGSPPELPPHSFPHGDDHGAPRLRFGPGLDDAGLTRRLVGPVDQKRVLELGCGTGAAAVALARSGARVTAIDSSTARLTRARHAAELAEVKVEFHHCDLADLAFVRADSIDVAVAIYSLAQVQDLGRVFRQLHRVMVPDGPLVLAFPHPLATMVEWDQEDQASPWLARSFWSDNPLAWHVAGDEGVTHVHQISAVFTALQRANFRVDTLAEPRPDSTQWSPHRSELDTWVPPTLLVRARKEGT